MESDNILSDENSSPNESEIKCGPDGKGMYLTPYQTTVVYDPNSLFQKAIGLLADRANMVPYCDKLFEYCDHPSPEVVLFGDNVSKDLLDKFFERNFKLIHIFSMDKEAYADIINKDPRVLRFDLDDFYEHIQFIGGMSVNYFLEHLICAYYSDYKSMCEGVDHRTGNYLINALKYQKLSLEYIISEKITSIHGFNTIDSLVIEGRAIIEHRELIANNQLAKGIPYELDENGEKTLIFAVHSDDLMPDLLGLIPMYPFIVKRKPHIVLLYTLENHYFDNNIVSGWRVVAIGLRASSHEFLMRFSGNVVGDYGKSTTWIQTSSATVLLPFIYSLSESTQSDQISIQDTGL